MRKRRQRGFTLVEVLATVAIMVVFLALSVVAIGSYQSKLKLTELDNAARQIYLAAQNRAVLLHSRSALEPLLEQFGDNTITDVDGQYKYITNAGADDDKKAALDQLLPVGTIDPSLREGQFYIVYEPDSGSVTDAFYSEDGAIANFPVYAIAPPSAEERRKEDPMVGWYSADPAEAGGASYLDVPEIDIINEDTLRAEITWSVPEELSDLKNDMLLRVTVTYAGSEIQLDDSRRISRQLIDDATTKDVYLLDSLVTGEHLHLQFQDLFPGTAPGGDFSLRAQVVYTGSDETSYIPQASEKTANSLFAAVENDGKEAHVSCLRHLQNLDESFSGVDGVSSAVQDKDIDKPSGDTGYILDLAGADADKYAPPETHDFQPITNDDLTSYDGQAHEIRCLHIAAGSSPAGLFSGFSGSLTKIRLMNADVSGGGYVGALCADAKNVTIDGCQVYWKAEKAGALHLRDQLGTADDTSFSLSGGYKITGGTVGGLIGNAENVTIRNCFAATTVSGAAVGGLVGHGDNDLVIEDSYADCYLSGSSAAAGLVGGLSGAGIRLDTVYAAGFISRSDTTPAAGLYLGSGAAVTNSYAAMTYSTSEGVYPLAENGTFTNAYYLGAFTNDDNGRSFTTAEELSSLSDDFAKPAVTYAYNLRTGVTLGNYPYPALSGLDHYGDWPVASPQQISKLVYWERYEDGTIGIWGSGGKYLKKDTDPHSLVVSDGYALLLDNSAFTDGEVSVEYKLNNPYAESVYATYNNESSTMLTYTMDGEIYYLAELPAELLYVPGIYDNRLRKLYTAIGGAEIGNNADTLVFSYDPHFAREPIEGTVEPDDAGTGYIRSARHLYDLLGRSGSYYGEREFVQELDIDYSAYDSAYVSRTGLSFEYQITPTDNFISDYDGQHHHIWNVSLKEADAMGLFGVNSSGTIKNVFFGGKDSEHVLEITGSAQNMGALVGINRGAGSIENCAVGYVKLNNTSTRSDAYVGGLVGTNTGTVKNCSASTDSITSNGGGAGGFAGIAGGTINHCYAISRINAGGGTAAGFAAANSAANDRYGIFNSYAAADLTGSILYAFAEREGSNCYYLDKGIYLGVPFSAPNDSFATATSMNWAELTGPDDPLLVPDADGDRFDHLAPGSEHRLPAIVKDANNEFFHYGNTVTEPLDTAPIGVYYWEYESGGAHQGYHFSVVTYDPKAGPSEVFKTQSDLCTAHDDGGVITDYGYGWFISKTLGGGWSNKIALDGIAYNGETSEKNWYINEQKREVSAALAGWLGLSADDFHSFPTAGNDGKGGLYLSEGKASKVNGILTIKHDNSGNRTAYFEINPFFANAISYSETVGPSGLGSEALPYEIRSVRQLQFINWNGENCTTPVEAGNGTQFPYLNADLAFRQTHDLDGQSGGFFPIAALRDGSSSGTVLTSIPAAFSGAYDGQSYVIRNISIGGEANTLGLFGTTLDAELASIILYSEKGDNTLTIQNSGIDNGWYYAGGLVGLALQTQDGSASITNCASAGLQITDRTTRPGEYGGTIGGLAGAANVPINKCTAVNDIYINYRRTEDDPHDVRVGGLAGACENDITSCYSGGSIKVDPICNDGKRNEYTLLVSLYIGRISGGVNTKLDNVSGLLNTNHLNIRDCYSYVTLPNDLVSLGLMGTDSRYRELYNIAGDAEYDLFSGGHITVEDSYYLRQDGFGGWFSQYVSPSDSSSDGRTFSQMADNDFLNALNQISKNFDRANSSYSPDILDAGKPYPFPAVLTRDGKYLHYGKLPVDGAASTSSVMTVDLFADYDAASGTAYQDNIVWPSRDLAERIPGGVFRPDLIQVVNAEDEENTEPVCQAAFVDESGAYPAPEDGQRILRVTFLRPGDAEVTVFYGQPGADIADCVGLTIPVTNTAELHMLPADTSMPDGGLDAGAAAYGPAAESVTAFAGAGTELELYPFDRNSEPIAPELKDKLSVTMTGCIYDGVSLTAAGPAEDMAPDAEDAPAAVSLDGAAATDGAQTMTVDYSYTIEGLDGTLTGSDDILYEVKDLTVEPDAIVFVRQGGAFLPDMVTYGPEDVRFTVGGEPAAVDDLRITNAVSPSGAVSFALGEDGSVTAAPGEESGAYALEQTQLDLTFNYGPASHSVSVYPLVCFYEDGMTLHLEGGDMNGGSSVNLYAGAAVEPLTTPVSPEDNAAPDTAGAGTPVRVLEYLAGDWSVQWSLDDALAPLVSLTADGGTAYLAVAALPETNTADGLLTVIVTLPEPWLGVTFTGSIPIHIVNENAPSPTSEPTQAPEVTPVPEDTAPPMEEVTPAPPVQEPEWQPGPDWQPEWDPEPVPDAPDVPDFLPEEEFIP